MPPERCALAGTAAFLEVNERFFSLRELPAGKHALGREMMESSDSLLRDRRKSALRIAVRIGSIVLLAFLIGWTLNRLSLEMEKSNRPAGFTRGLLQGALMPMAMPNLLVGKDVIIYAQRNTGVSYKLGYTAGVNGCGLIFFGLFFWRVSRLRAALASQQAISGSARQSA